MKALKFLFVFFAIGVGLYPLLYFITDMNDGLLSSKPASVIASDLWRICFYIHIGFGGIALLFGWAQFFKSIRSKFMTAHRRVGMLYCISVWLSGLAGLYIATKATGGFVSELGFGMLAILWLYTTTKAFITIKRKDILNHQKWMIRSYALCFAAVTLRLWLPIFIGGLGFDFVDAYRIIAWLCWVPNIIVGELLIRKYVN